MRRCLPPLLTLALALASSSILRAQDASWTYTLAAGGLITSAPRAHVFDGAGGTITGSATFAVAPLLGIAVDGLWTILPAEAFRTPRQVTTSVNYCPPQSSCSCPPGTFCVPASSTSPVRGGAGLAGIGTSLVLGFPPGPGPQPYLLAGTGAYRAYTVPHSETGGWRAARVLTTGAETLAFGLRFGARERYGMELRAEHFNAGLVRWVYPMAITFRP